jgi:hypothetical protein
MLAAAALAACLSGCVTLRLEAPDGGVQVVRGFGVLHVALPSPETAVVGMVSGVGIVDAPLGVSLGYTSQRWALLGPECRTVAWAPPGGFTDATRSLLVHAAGACQLSSSTSPRELP